MKTMTSIKILAALAVAAFSTASQAAVIFTPGASGDATGSGFFGMERGFDDQPILSDLVDNQYIADTSLQELGATPGDQPSRQGYVDFGTSFSSIQIVGLWTAYRKSSNVTAEPFAELWWSDTKDNVRGAVGTYTDINAAQFNFATRSVSTPTAVMWTQDFDLSGAPVTPEHRYLILSTAATGFSDGARATEFAITVVPEPSAILLVGLGVIALVSRRRRA